jgi:hypothetical protein
LTLRVRSYSEMIQYSTFLDRYEYLKLRSSVGEATFGFDRYINQNFYRSTEWKQVRDHVIARDYGRDLGIAGQEIFDRVIIHHMNPMRLEDIDQGDPDILNPEYLITVSHETHNAIHFGDATKLRKEFEERRPGDTRLW